MTNSKKGKVDLANFRKLVEKKIGRKITYDSSEDKINPAIVKEWIPSGSRWFDCIIASGQMGGIPVGKRIEIAGGSASGKSFWAALIAKSALGMGITPVIFDTERSWNRDFVEMMGITYDDMIYSQPTAVEEVFEIIETLLPTGERFLFVWDSYAATPTRKELEESYDPNENVAQKARVTSKGLNKLTGALADAQSTMIVINQLSTIIGVGKYERVDFGLYTGGVWYAASGGKKLNYFLDMKLFIVPRKAKGGLVHGDEKVATGGGKREEVQIGNEVEIRVVKNRFGPEGRKCRFPIQYGGGQVRIMDRESWLESIRTFSGLTKSGNGRYTLVHEGAEFKFTESSFLKMLDEPDFRKAVKSVMTKELIHKPLRHGEQDGGA